mmetsp:Transcript_10846/g.19316  ORF Transcript_10846/g.19316 Transcript_10846/m.19316 type:complete len:178 (+) Transcript_10846:889-1422(+)
MVSIDDAALTFINLDIHGRLVVLNSGELPSPAAGHAGVAGHHLGKHTTLSLNPQGQRVDIDQDEGVHCLITNTTKNGTLHCSAVRNSLVRIDRLAQGLTAEVVLQQLLDLRDTCGATNQHNLVNVVLAHLGVFQHTLDGSQAPLKQSTVQLLKCGAADAGIVLLTTNRDLNIGGHSR